MLFFLRIGVIWLPRFFLLFHSFFEAYSLFLTFSFFLRKIRFLHFLLHLPDESYCFEDTPTQLSTVDRPRNLKVGESRVLCWYSVDLIQRLIQIANDPSASDEIIASVSALFDYPLKHCPEVLVLSLAETHAIREALAAASVPSRPKGKVELEWSLFSILISSFLTTNHRSAAHVLRALWASHPPLVVRGMAEVYQSQPSQITRLFDIAQELKGLRRVLDTAPIIFSMDMATLAWRRGYLNLDSWLLQNISTHQRSFVSACVRYLLDRSGSGEGGGSSGDVGFMSNHLTNEARVVILKVLQNWVSLMSPSTLEEYKKLTARYAHLIPPTPSTPPITPGALAPGATPPRVAMSPSRTSGGVPSTGTAPGAGPAAAPLPSGSYPNTKPSGSMLDTQKSFPPEIEEAANAYFQQIYTSQITIDDAVALLSRCKASSNPREQDVFNCMIHNLFDEYRFFHKYPDKELEITGVLFGSLIQHQLVSLFALALALRSVLDALRTPNTKMFRFGYLALQQFKGRLQEWPQYCAQVSRKSLKSEK
jgi:CCR4-NOT transcription complex subunit 1